MDPSKQISLCLLMLGLLAVSGSAQTNPDAELLALNNYLIDHVSSQSVEDNMEAARQLLTKKSSSFSFFKKDRNGSLEKFVALDTIKNLENQCDRASFSILNDICQANDFRGIGELNPGNYLRRIDSIIRQYSIQHAERCMDTYSTAFERKYEEMDKTQLHRVVTHADIVMNTLWPALDGPYRNERDFHQSVLASIKFYTDYSFKRTSCRALRTLASETHDPDAKFLSEQVPDERAGVLRVNEPKVKAMAKTYLFDPCREYVDKLGADVFEPFQFDIKVIGDGGYKLDKVLEPGSPMHSFYSGLARYKFCERVLNAEEYIQSTIVECVKSHSLYPSQH
mgnify:CR=1 FL=1